ncbi:MAG: type 1 glutamine amidotransferase [Planctomycetota bacterium]
MTAFQELDVLFLQARELEAVAAHERFCLSDLCDLREEQVDAVNFPLEGYVEWGRVEQADAVIVGGSGVYSATDHHDWIERMLDTVRRVIETGKPMFAVCFGQHLIARALGGEVVTDPKHREIGAREIYLTPAGNDDPIFGRCPSHFPALLAHNDHVRTLPDGCVELAKNETCPNQAFRVKDKPVYATLFHAELTPRTLLDRLQRYRGLYCPDQEEFEEAVASLRPTPDAESILKRFLTQCVAQPA